MKKFGQTTGQNRIAIELQFTVLSVQSKRNPRRNSVSSEFRISVSRGRRTGR